jgi:hypothetical protein
VTDATDVLFYAADDNVQDEDNESLGNNKPQHEAYDDLENIINIEDEILDDLVTLNMPLNLKTLILTKFTTTMRSKKEMTAVRDNQLVDTTYSQTVHGNTHIVFLIINRRTERYTTICQWVNHDSDHCHGRDKKTRDRAVDAVLAEFRQLDDNEVLNPMYAKDVTSAKKHDTLRAINLIKGKRCGKLRDVPVRTEGHNKACTPDNKPHLQQYPPTH